jgi:LysR family hydrogen peroxide-inducible transcriptional activator
MVRPSLRQLSYLIAIEDNGSFSAAADECAVTQSTLSAGIKELENIMRHQLVTRGKKRATLTPFGLEVASQARQILSDTDDIVSRAQMLEAPLSGPLRLGIIPTIAPYVLPHMLPHLNKKFPQLELQIHEDLTDRLLDKLQRGALDTIVMAFPYDTPGCHQDIIYSEKFFVAMPAETKTKGNTIAMSDLEPEKLLLLEDGHCLRDHALSACDIQLPRQRKTFSATSLQTLIEMVRAGLGMTLLPEMAVKQSTLGKEVKLLPFKGNPQPVRQIGLCWRTGDARAEDFALLAEAIK